MTSSCEAVRLSVWHTEQRATPVWASWMKDVAPHTAHGWSAEGSPSAGSQDGVEEAAGRSFGGGWGGPPPPTGDRGDREGMDSRTGDREGLDSRRRGDLVGDLFGDLFMVARSPLSPRYPGAALYPGILC